MSTTEAIQAARPTTPRRALRPIVAACVVLAVVVSAALMPVDRWLLALVEWIRGAGAVGAAVFSLAYVAAAVLLLPGSVLTLGAGFAYGPVLGTLLVSPASVAAATAAFLLGRTTARGFVARRIAGDPRFSAVDAAIQRNGFKIVLLLRLSPVFPFNVLNYALGVTTVRLRDYVLASFLGMLPGTILYVYLGSLVTSAAEIVGGERPDAGPWGHVLFFGGLAATVAATVAITRTARRALDRALAGDTPGGSEDAS